MAMRGPRTAPEVSIARWKPKARPREEASVEAAMRASRGAVRMPLPARSRARAERTAGRAKGGARGGEEDGGPGEGGGERWFGRGGKGVAGHGERDAPAELIGQPAEDELQEAGRALGDTFDYADGEGGRSEGAGEEERDDGVDHLAADVGEEADGGEQDNVAGEARDEGVAGGFGRGDQRLRHAPPPATRCRGGRPVEAISYGARLHGS